MNENFYAALKSVSPYRTLLDEQAGTSLVGLFGALERGEGEQAMDQYTALFEQITALADANDIPWQVKTLLSGGTDASAIQRSREGCRVAAISAAVRYIHSPSCVGCTRDFEQMAALLRLLLADLEVKDV